MTEQQKLREAVARALYERSRNWFRDDPETRGLGDDWEVFADQVFPPWDTVDNKKRYLEDADAAIAACRPFHRAEALEEAARVAENHAERNSFPTRQGAIAAAIRALISSASSPSQSAESGSTLQSPQSSSAKVPD